VEGMFLPAGACLSLPSPVWVLRVTQSWNEALLGHLLGNTHGPVCVPGLLEF
jgi:hypothetical protein